MAFGFWKSCVEPDQRAYVAYLTRRELPDTMVAIRLFGIEISDLTMELSDLGQDISNGLSSSTKAVCIAEQRLLGLTNMKSRFAPAADPSLTIKFYERTPEQQAALGYLADLAQSMEVC